MCRDFPWSAWKFCFLPQKGRDQIKAAGVGGGGWGENKRSICYLQANRFGHASECVEGAKRVTGNGSASQMSVCDVM